MGGEALRDGLRTLVARFDEIAVPDHGRYVPDDQGASQTGSAPG
jgi:hypothetical protein